MAGPRRCSQCGTALSAGALEGLCPKCLLARGMQGAGATPQPTRSTPDAGGFVPPEPAEIAPHFPQLEVLELLGVGGMGMVYKARQPALDRLVALKILLPRFGGDPTFAERFTREARSLARLNHTHIVTVYHFGETGRWYYFIMEYVDGASLRQMERAQRLSPAEALALVPQICDALQYAHDEGIVHRDIKPENILVDRKGRVKIADFGLAKLLHKTAADLTLTRTRQAMGTPNYMAPEQMERPLEVDQRADIYSLGVVLYEMLTGELPIGRFAPPSQKAEIDVRLDEVVLRALEKEPQRRYQQASEVKTDLSAIADAQGARATPSRRGALWLLAGALAGAAAAVVPAFLSLPESSRPGDGQATSKGRPGFVPVPDPLYGKNPTHPLIARKRPAPGERFLDGRFKTPLTRVTQQKRLRHEHAGHDPFNKDQSLIVLYDSDSGEHQVFRTRSLPYDQSANRVQALDIDRPRWDGEDPDVIWGFDGLKIVTVNFRTRQTAVVKDFAKDPAIAPVLKAPAGPCRITTGAEGEPSRDKRLWALMLQDSKEDDRARCLFTWDRRTDRVLGVRKLQQDEDVDWVGMSWKGGWVLINAEEGKGRLSGLMMADKELTRFHRLAHTAGAVDVGLDVDGNEVVVMQNSRTDYIDLVAVDWKTTPVAEGEDEYAATNRTRLVRLFYSSESDQGFNGEVYLCGNCPGYCVVSTSTKPNVREQNWLDRSIILVRLDPRQPKAYYLAKVHGTDGSYWERTQATIASDGATVLWASNWNEDVGKEEVFLIQLGMPKDWRNLLK